MARRSLVSSRPPWIVLLWGLRGLRECKIDVITPHSDKGSPLDTPVLTGPSSELSQAGTVTAVLDAYSVKEKRFTCLLLHATILVVYTPKMLH